MSEQHAEQDAEEIASLRLRSRTSTTSTNSKLDPFPSPVIPTHTSRPKNHRGAGRKLNKSTTRRSSLNQRREKKKTDSNSPPISKNENDTTMNDDPNVTRCVCEEDNEEANDVIMFQCDKCSVWQHGPCVGLYAEFPGDYFCEKCRPDLHASGQYQKSSPHQPSRRSPSFTSSTTRRDRVNPDAASLAAFLTDAGVKPEDQISLGGFALPTFAQTRRQSNMLVDGVVPHPHKKQCVMESSPGLSANGICETTLPEIPKPKRKRPSDQIHSPTSPNADSILGDKQKRPRISPAAELLSPAPSVSTTTSRQHNPPSVPTQSLGPPTKQRRTRKVDDTDDSAGPSNKGKTLGVFGAKSTGVASTSGPGRRGSPIKRTNKEDGRRSKNQSNTNAHHQEQQQLEVSLSEGWGLPDHLSYLEYLLPTPTPQPIIIESIGEGSKTIKEPPTKVKFPSKRSTIADLRKRSKHLVDYLQKVQIESCDREKRNELIFKSLQSKRTLDHHHSNLSNDFKIDHHDLDLATCSLNNNHHNQFPNSFFSSVQSVVSDKTLQIIDDLSRQLYHWQEKFKQN